MKLLCFCSLILAVQSLTTEKYEKETVKVVEFYKEEATANQKNGVQVVELPQNANPNEDYPNPFECCDASEFIKPEWRSECGFEVKWDQTRRLVVQDQDTPASTTTPPVPAVTPASSLSNDVKVVPITCEKTSCVFNKLNMISDTGAVKMDAFKSLLHNFTRAHPLWTKAKGRAITKCLTYPVKDYEAQCEINKILGCTVDVLSENCPHTKKMDPCKHSRSLKNGTVCQVNASKFRPKNRRLYCGLPYLVNHRFLEECGITSLTKIEYVPEPVTIRPFRKWPSRSWCKESSQASMCLMKKMNVINRYDFMDHFKMSELLRSFVEEHADWEAFKQEYLTSFVGIPLYKDHCSTPRKLMNVLDSVIKTCPVSKRKNTPQCQKLFEEAAIRPPVLPRPTLSFFGHLRLNQSLDMSHLFNRLKDATLDAKLHKFQPPKKYVSAYSADGRKPIVVLPMYQYLYMRPINNDGVWRHSPAPANQISTEKNILP